MAVQLFRLRNVPDDEADEIRNLLEHHQIEFYETPAGNWGISMPAIWLHDDEQLENAKALIDEYQQQRFDRIKREKKQQALEGDKKSGISEIIKNPIQAILYLAFAGVILYFSIKPFLNFGQ